MRFVFPLDEGTQRTPAKLIYVAHSCPGITSRHVLEANCTKQNLRSFIMVLQKDDKTKTFTPAEDFELIKFLFFTSFLPQEVWNCSNSSVTRSILRDAHMSLLSYQHLSTPRLPFEKHVWSAAAGRKLHLIDGDHHQSTTWWEREWKWA